MSRIFWDTMLFVYWLEDRPAYAPRVNDILSRMRERNDEWCTSSLAVGEVLVGFCKQQGEEAVQRVQEFFHSTLVRIVPFTVETATRYAMIRAKLAVSPADAIHLACAAEADTDLFLTNDTYLVGKIVPGIKFIAGLQTDLL
jgi:predicted nucleic acid-binding protein